MPVMSTAKNEFQVSLELADKSQEPRWRELCLQEIMTSPILNISNFEIDHHKNCHNHLCRLLWRLWTTHWGSDQDLFGNKRGNLDDDSVGFAIFTIIVWIFGGHHISSKKYWQHYGSYNWPLWRLPTHWIASGLFSWYQCCCLRNLYSANLLLTCFASMNFLGRGLRCKGCTASEQENLSWGWS